MAEIKVERKKQTPIWPWIIGILLLLGIIWFLIEAFNEDTEMENEFEEVDVEQSFAPENVSHPASLELADFSKA